MGFFDKLGAQLTNASRTVSQNVKNASDSSSLNRKINSHQKNIQQKYAEIGQLFFEKYGNNPENEFAEQTASIKNSMEEIVSLQAEIEEVKARKAELVPIPEDTPKPTTSTAPATMVCTKCGNTYTAPQEYCSVCGEKLVPHSSQPVATETVIPTPVPEEEAAPESSVTVADETPEESSFSDSNEPERTILNEPEVTELKIPSTKKFCTHCGAENESDSTFCVVCGNSLN